MKFRIGDFLTHAYLPNMDFDIFCVLKSENFQEYYLMNMRTQEVMYKSCFFVDTALEFVPLGVTIKKLERIKRKNRANTLGANGTGVSEGCLVVGRKKSK